MINSALFSSYCRIHRIAVASLEMQTVQLELKLVTLNRTHIIASHKDLIEIFLAELQTQEFRLVSAVEAYSDEVMSEVSGVTKIFDLATSQQSIDSASFKKWSTNLPREVSESLKESEEKNVLKLKKLFSELRDQVEALKIRLDAL